MEKRRGRKPKITIEDAKAFGDGQVQGIKLPAKGLGDTVEQVLEATGIAKAVKWLAGEDCGCEERKKKLNELFPYRKANCMTEEEFTTLNNFFARDYAEIRVSDQNSLLRIYNRVLNQRQETTSCSSCWRDIIAQLRKLHNEYADSNS